MFTALWVGVNLIFTKVVRTAVFSVSMFYYTVKKKYLAKLVCRC